MQAIKKIAFFALLLLLPLSASAIDIPRPTGFVNDLANVIDSQTRVQLDNILTGFSAQTGNEVVVATVQSLQGEPVENFAVKMFEEWGIGKKDKDNGALILVAPNERKMRIEVGYGLEPFVNDALAGRIIRDTMVPHFKTGDYSLGILNGSLELVTTIAKRSGVEFNALAAGKISPDTRIYHVEAAPKKEASLVGKVFKIIFIVFVILLFIKNPWAALFILSNVGGGGRGGSFRGGFGGGFSGFGGGSSGGGGASGSW